MRCPYCHGRSTRVMETRESVDETRRRRECDNCNKRFTTFEKVEKLSITIVKNNQNRQPYSRDKLVLSFQKACEKRPVPAVKIEKAVEAIEAELRQKKADEVESRVLGELVMDQIRELDEVAYIRYASVYRKFADLEAFKEEVQKLEQQEKKEENIPWNKRQ